VEPTGGETFVNGHAISKRMQVDYPASVRVGEVTLAVERRASRVGEAVSLSETIPFASVQPSGPASSGSDVATTLHSPSSKAAEPHMRGEDPSLAETRPATGSAGRPRVRQVPVAAEVNEAEVLCKYALVGEIARGGMGQIHLGEDAQLKRQVAVKVSTLAYAGEDPRFAKEAEVLAQLAHPNIVPIYATGTDAQGRPFYSMKLIKGRTLQAVLNAIRDGNAAAISEYSRAALLTIFRKVCDALAFAHSKRILHRDLKPENIMVGEYGEVLVMDWGLAKVLGEREENTGAARAQDAGDYGMTLEGEVMGTPQYMSPEQAQGMVADLDVRSDIYSLGGILYAILTLRPPVEGRTLNEVLTKVKNGEISSMVTRRGDGATVSSPAAMDREVPEALQAVTLKAMALDREKRYGSVEAFAADIEAYQNGFATQAEGAGVWKQAALWIKRNRVLTGAAAVLSVVVTGSTARVIQKGREANRALQSLRDTAPTFAMRAKDALHDGHFEEALRAATFAANLQPESAPYQALRGNVLQLLMRWPEAVTAYQTALRGSDEESTRTNLSLTEQLIGLLISDGEVKARGALFEALNAQGRQYEAMFIGRDLGDFWKSRKTTQREDPSAVPELVQSLEAKLLPIPGTGVLMSKTEFTVGEWKLYTRAAGLPEWMQPGSWRQEKPDFIQNDDHPLVYVSWKQAKDFCAWLSGKTGKEWRLPTEREWEAAQGDTLYPWGDDYPPSSDAGNYAVSADGSLDPQMIGMDGVFGTAPVASFKPNALGFYDLGGNVFEWMWEEIALTNRKGGHCPIVRGGGWNKALEFCKIAPKWPIPADYSGNRHDYNDSSRGFRIVRRVGE
jgi:serine/threonine protein kinase/formylglycine-generating enzyme required for sulfatase activity